MIVNYFKIAYRNLLSHPGYSSLNILGLAMGIASAFVLFLVLIALVIASPIAWYMMEYWLEDFAYRINIKWWIFIVSGFSGVGMAFLTIGFQSIKAALANPVQSLRNE